MLVIAYSGKASELWKALEFLAKVAGKLTLGECVRLQEKENLN